MSHTWRRYTGERWGFKFHTYEWVMSHTWMSHVTHMDKSCHAHEWVMSRTWLSHVTHIGKRRVPASVPRTTCQRKSKRLVNFLKSRCSTVVSQSCLYLFSITNSVTRWLFRIVSPQKQTPGNFSQESFLSLLCITNPGTSWIFRNFFHDAKAKRVVAIIWRQLASFQLVMGWLWLVGSIKL